MHTDPKKTCLEAWLCCQLKSRTASQNLGTDNCQPSHTNLLRLVVRTRDMKEWGDSSDVVSQGRNTPVCLVLLSFKTRMWWPRIWEHSGKTRYDSDQPPYSHGFGECRWHMQRHGLKHLKYEVLWPNFRGKRTFQHCTCSTTGPFCSNNYLQSIVCIICFCVHIILIRQPHDKVSRFDFEARHDENMTGNQIPSPLRRVCRTHSLSTTMSYITSSL